MILMLRNPEGYRKTKELIEKFQKDGKKITSYRIKNMGDSDPSQKFERPYLAASNLKTCHN
nr:hypothetical protein [Mycoplasmopsis bovis]